MRTLTELREMGFNSRQIRWYYWGAITYFADLLGGDEVEKAQTFTVRFQVDEDLEKYAFDIEERAMAYIHNKAGRRAA